MSSASWRRATSGRARTSFRTTRSGSSRRASTRWPCRLEKNRSELEDLNRNLEFRAAEKTDNLTRAYERLQLSNQNLAVANRELEEVNRKLKEIDQVKSDFISIVSHELRTPLTSIKAFTELILMKPEDALGETREAAEDHQQ